MGNRFVTPNITNTEYPRKVTPNMFDLILSSSTDDTPWLLNAIIFIVVWLFFTGIFKGHGFFAGLVVLLYFIYNSLPSCGFSSSPSTF